MAVAELRTSPSTNPRRKRPRPFGLPSGGRPRRRKARPMDTASLFALLLADRLAGRQRRLLPARKIRL